MTAEPRNLRSQNFALPHPTVNERLGTWTGLNRLAWAQPEIEGEWEIAPRRGRHRVPTKQRGERGRGHGALWGRSWDFQVDLLKLKTCTCDPIFSARNGCVSETGYEGEGGLRSGSVKSNGEKLGKIAGKLRRRNQTPRSLKEQHLCTGDTQGTNKYAGGTGKKQLRRHIAENYEELRTSIPPPPPARWQSPPSRPLRPDSTTPAATPGVRPSPVPWRAPGRHPPRPSLHSRLPHSQLRSLPRTHTAVTPEELCSSSQSLASRFVDYCPVTIGNSTITLSTVGQSEKPNKCSPKCLASALQVKQDGGRTGDCSV